MFFKKSYIELAAHGFSQFKILIEHDSTPEYLQIKTVSKIHLQTFCAGFSGGLLAAGYPLETIHATMEFLVPKLRKEYNLQEPN